MTDVTEAPAGPVVLARGRFKLSEAPDGSLVAAAALNLCERCQECGCGEPTEPKVIPGMLVKMLHGKFLKMVTGNGHADQPE